MHDRSWRSAQLEGLQDSAARLANPCQDRGRGRPDRLQRRRFFFQLVGFDHIADLDVVIRRDADTALHAVDDFLDVILEPAQRSARAGLELDAIANDSAMRMTHDLPLEDI